MESDRLDQKEEGSSAAQGESAKTEAGGNKESSQGEGNKRIPPIMVGPRCGARTRSGGSCRAPAANGKARCRMHGGSKGSGAPKQNLNALKHGAYAASFKNEELETARLTNASLILMCSFIARDKPEKTKPKARRPKRKKGQKRRAKRLHGWWAMGR